MEEDSIKVSHTKNFVTVKIPVETIFARLEEAKSIIASFEGESDEDTEIDKKEFLQDFASTYQQMLDSYKENGLIQSIDDVIDKISEKFIPEKTILIHKGNV